MHATTRKLVARAVCVLAPIVYALPAYATERSIAWPYVANGSTRTGTPPGWSRAGNAPEHFQYYTDTAQGLAIGKRMASIASDFRHPQPPGKYFATVMQSISAQAYRGKRVRFSAQLRTQDVGGGALWMRIVNADGKVLSFDNMESRQVTGTRDWEQQSVVLDVPAESAEIDFGFLLDGKGEVDAAEFVLVEVDRNVNLTANTVPGPEKSVLPNAPSNLDLSQM